ncbi:BON domain-containing protein [Deinococcus aquatilis]|uniref:BON domain-containing protein n=1 Tax=Deinococcus aquatilis TaxID=519440 RepID=UPI0003666B50|nr:BON domain-containing protein [Deinococcus aquatilis]
MWPFGKSTADRVKDALNAQPRLEGLGLQVTESRGNVTISGMVPNDRYEGLVRIVAEGINGVKSVDVSGLVAEETTPVPASAPAQAAPATPSPSISAPNIGTPAPAAPKKAASPSLEAEIKEAEDNSKIAKAVHSAIKNNGELKDDPIDVLQSGKSIILRGVVDNDHEQRLAEQLARAVPGVASVDVSGLKVAAGAKELTKEKDTDTGDTVYTVKAGDTLGEIAQKYYGNAAEYKKIAHYNNISNPDLIKVGQKLRIPS